MEISFIDIVLIISVLCNFALFRKLSDRVANKADVENLRQEFALNSNEIESVKNYAENIHFHHNILSQSIIFHLHASGTAYQSRIWKTYEVEVNKEWDFDEHKWPDYLPILNSSSIEISGNEYDEWLSVCKSEIYSKHPNQIIDYDYIYEMDRTL